MGNVSHKLCERRLELKHQTESQSKGASEKYWAGAWGSDRAPLGPEEDRENSLKAGLAPAAEHLPAAEEDRELPAMLCRFPGLGPEKAVR